VAARMVPGFGTKPTPMTERGTVAVCVFFKYGKTLLFIKKEIERLQNNIIKN
jgi:hypothetical protein